MAKPAGLDALKFIHDLVNRHGVAPSGQAASDAGGKRNMFHNGLISFRASGPWEFGFFDAAGDTSTGASRYLPMSARQANVVHGSSYLSRRWRGDPGSLLGVHQVRHDVGYRREFHSRVHYARQFQGLPKLGGQQRLTPKRRRSSSSPLSGATTTRNRTPLWSGIARFRRRSTRA